MRITPRKVTMAQTGVKLKNNVTWYDYNGKENLKKAYNLLSQASSDSENLKTVVNTLNDFQNRHADLRKKATDKNDFTKTAYNPIDESVLEYQKDYISTKRLFSNNDNIGWNFSFTANNADPNEKFDLSGKKRYAKEFKDDSWKWEPDNLYSSITDLRYILGRKIDGKDDFTNEQLNEFNGQLKKLGLELRVNSSNDYYNLEYLNDDSNSQKENSSQDNKIEMSNSQESESKNNSQNENDNNGSEFSGTQQNDGSSKKSFWSSFSSRLSGPDLLAAARLLPAWRTNRKVYQTLNKAIRPKLHNTYELYRPVTGDNQQKQFFFRQAADTQRLAAQPRTSDASLQLAGELDANKQARDLQYKGYLADDQEIKRTSEAALALQQDNIKRRTETANYNRDQINDTIYKRGELKASKQRKDWEILDNYLQGVEANWRQNRENMKSRYYQVNSHEAKNQYKDALDQLTKSYGLENASTSEKLANSEYTDAVQALNRNYQSQLDSLALNYDYPSRSGYSNGFVEWNDLLKKYLKPKPATTSTTTPANTTTTPTQTEGNKKGGKLVKKKVGSFQNGGYFDKFFAEYKPILNPQSSSSGSSKSSSRSSSSDDDEKGKLTESKLYSMFAELDGLPNEVTEIAREFQAQMAYENLTGLSSSNLGEKFIQTKLMIVRAKQNKNNFDEAMKSVQQNGALGEVAINLNGDIAVQDMKTGQVGFKPLSEIDPDECRVLTNSQLANLRAYEPSLSFTNQRDRQDVIIDTLNNSIGYESFQKLLQQGITSLGTDRGGNTTLSRAEQDTLAGLQTLQDASDEEKQQLLNGILKDKSTWSDQEKQFYRILSYLESVMPKRMKVWSQVKLLQNQDVLANQYLNEYGRKLGTLPDAGTQEMEEIRQACVNQARMDIQNALQNPTYALGILLTNNLQSRMSTTYIDDKSLSGTRSGSSKSGSGSGSDGYGAADNDAKATWLTQMQVGHGTRDELRTLNLGDNASLHVFGQTYPSVADTSGKPIMDSNLAQVMSESGMAGISNNQSIYFGNQRIDSNKLQAIAVMNNGGYRAWLPCVNTGNGIRPDFELLESYGKVVDRVSQRADLNTTAEQREQMLAEELAKEPDLQQLLTVTGQIDKNKVRPFFIMQGMASDKNFDFQDPDKNKWMSRTKDDTDFAWFDKVTAQELDNQDWWETGLPVFWGKYDKLYKGDIFVPIDIENRMSALIFSGQKPKEGTAKELNAEYQGSRTLENKPRYGDDSSTILSN